MIGILIRLSVCLPLLLAVADAGWSDLIRYRRRAIFYAQPETTTSSPSSSSAAVTAPHYFHSSSRRPSPQTRFADFGDQDIEELATREGLLTKRMTEFTQQQQHPSPARPSGISSLAARLLQQRSELQQQQQKQQQQKQTLIRAPLPTVPPAAPSLPKSHSSSPPSPSLQEMLLNARQHLPSILKNRGIDFATLFPNQSPVFERFARALLPSTTTTTTTTTAAPERPLLLTENACRPLRDEKTLRELVLAVHDKFREIDQPDSISLRKLLTAAQTRLGPAYNYAIERLLQTLLPPNRFRLTLADVVSFDATRLELLSLALGGRLPGLPTLSAVA